MRIRRLILFLLLIGSASDHVNGQVTGQINASVTIPELTRIDLEPDVASLMLSLDSPLEAGQPTITGVSASNNSRWINYTCALAPGGSVKKIYVQLTNGIVPPGTRLTVQASSYSGGGAGVMGSATGVIILGNIAQILVNNIGAGFTGNGINNGHRLTYQLSVTDFSKLNFSSSGTLQIAYTISD